MPWTAIKLNDGTTMPSIAFGTGSLGNGQQTVDNIDQAISVGFSHIDTAQSYKNELEAGQAIHESGLERNELYITTKYSGLDGLDIETSIRNSVKNLGVDYVDLYLIHHPWLAQPDIPTAWEAMEKVVFDGLAKSIGVSNFEIGDLAIVLAYAKIKPVVNQILLHPSVYNRQKPLIEYSTKCGVVSEGYSLLLPLRQPITGTVSYVANSIAARLQVKPEQVLLAWAKAKGVVVVTASSKKERLEGYIDAGDIDLSAEDVETIDFAGILGFGTLREKNVELLWRVAKTFIAVSALWVILRHTSLIPSFN